MLPILVRQARASLPLTYEAVAKELMMEHHRPVTGIVAYIALDLVDLGKQFETPVPPITALVVNKNTGLPGGGFYDAIRSQMGTWLADSDRFNKMSRLEKLDAFQLIYKKLAHYQWNHVLKQFGLVAINESATVDATREYVAHCKPTEESHDHKELKRFVARNPAMVGLPRVLAPGEIERVFPSADRADVSYTDNKQWTVVEVKPKSAPECEIIRGLFQCAKYQALMHAEQVCRNENRRLKTILVLGGALTAKARKVASTLGVEVVENILPNNQREPHRG